MRLLLPLLLSLLFAFSLPPQVRAEVAPEPVGVVEILPDTSSPDWLWATDPILTRVALLDFETNRVLGSVGGGWGITVPLFPVKNHHEFFVPETHYSRGSRGERTDVVTVYDARTLKPVAEVIIPPKRAHNALPIGNAALSDDEQFIAVFNMTPAQSISIVDTRQRKFVGEIATPGCSLVYPAGERRFMMLCADGSLLFVSLKSDGQLQHIQTSAKVFDPQSDPITEKAVRIENILYFVSFEGFVYGIDVTTTDIQKLSIETVAPWSLISNAERDERWRVGGRQFVAADPLHHRLLVLMHRGEVDTHKEGGTHLWAFDLKTREKTAAIRLLSPGFTFSGVPTEFGTGWIWPFNNLYNWLSAISFIEPHARPDSIVITPGEHPRLLVTGQFTGMVAVYDAASLEFSHRVTTGNIANLGLFLKQGPRPVATP